MTRSEPKAVDCSSFIARLSLDVFRRYVKWFGDAPSAWTMSEKFETIGLPEPGDLVFYCRPNPDPDRPLLYHVMMSCGGGAVVGACGIKERVIRYECELYSPC